MEMENVVVNGDSHEPQINELVDEKVLKPRRSVAAKETVEIDQKGTNENGSNDDAEPKHENGHDEALMEEAEKAKSTKARSSSGSKKESTPKPETPAKRELRPKETTPKPETTPGKRRGRSTKTPIKSPLIEEDKNINGKQDDETKDLNGSIDEESSVIFEGAPNKDDSVVIIENSPEDVKQQPKQSDGYLATLRRSFSFGSSSQPASPSVKDKGEVIISSPICLDTPPSERNFTPNSDVRGRKPIDPFFRFSGQSFGSNTSMKRKAEESYNGNDSGRKRFAGETESGSEQSPGWRFVSPFRKKWSPRHQMPSSTPFPKVLEGDSMAANFGDDSSLSLGESSSNGTQDAPPASIIRRCSIM